MSLLSVVILQSFFLMTSTVLSLGVYLSPEPSLDSSARERNGFDPGPCG